MCNHRLRIISSNFIVLDRKLHNNVSIDAGITKIEKEDSTINYKHKSSLLFTIETPVSVLRTRVQRVLGPTSKTRTQTLNGIIELFISPPSDLRSFSVYLHHCFSLLELVQANIIRQSSISITIISVIRNLIKDLREDAAVIAL